jgi:hypothetical protein
MSKENFFVLQMPACLTIDAIGFVEPSTSGSKDSF